MEGVIAMLDPIKVFAFVVILCGIPTTVYGQSYYYPAPARPQLYYPAPHQDYYPPVPEDYPSAQPQYRPPQYGNKQSSDLSYKCAQASEYIKNNNCGPQGCNCGLYFALQQGCHINSWGHTPDCRGVK